jgi:hypothetical protein
MMKHPRWAVVEYIRDDLPCRVTIHCHDDPLEPRDGESVRWLVGDLSSYAASRLAAERSRQIVRWSGGTPAWLQSHVLALPGNQPHRRVICVDGDERRLYSSLVAASRAENIDRTVIRRRIADRRPDARGRRWFDAPTM